MIECVRDKMVNKIDTTSASMPGNHLSATREVWGFRENIGSVPDVGWGVKKSFPEEMRSKHRPRG